MLPGCAEILQSVELKINSTDETKQDEFNVVERTLTLKETIKSNDSPYPRRVQTQGSGEKARHISENEALLSTFPRTNEKSKYKIGRGDILSFVKLVDNIEENALKKNRWPAIVDKEPYKLGIGDGLELTQIIETEKSKIETENGSSEKSSRNIGETSQDIVTSRSTIGSDGSVLLLEVGRLEAAGRTLNQLRSEVRNNFIRNGKSTRFQLEISSFNSRRVFLSIDGVSQLITLTSKPISLREVLSQVGKGIKLGITSSIELQRKGEIFHMSLREVLDQNAPNVIIQDADYIFIDDSTSETTIQQSTVSETGHVVFSGLGKIKVAGKTLDEVRREISKLVLRLPNTENAFLVEISEFLSQYAIISIPNVAGKIIPITDRKIDLTKLLAEGGLSVDGQSIIRINLRRFGKNYNFTLESLVERSYTDPLYLTDGDLITVQQLSYKPNKVFILGSGVNPTIINIEPSIRETLADVLFNPSGVLGSSSAKKSEVYLLRGADPIYAYRLDAKNPTRLLVADKMELRPNDILYVAEQPLSSFNRTLVTIAPLRFLIRDIQANNIP